MSEVKRYEAESDPQDGPCSIWMEESAEGAYVTYSDYQKLVADADKSLNENLRLKEKIHAHELYIRALEVERKAFEKSSETIHNLVAENSALLKFIKDDCFVYTRDIGEPSDANDFKPETPVTEAAISDIKAQGVDDLVARRTAAARIAMEHNDKANSVALSGEAARAAMFADDLRAGRKG
ncbi:hypothetical protein CWS43_10055 [Rahnella sp. AA]|uniref:hypothetical protein n=1 Tax=Rahnella sp. AA TaxID=2057180 RepID=UPI000C321958|nr:hypothetical protein [Rahnella sp. AA]PKE31011.1 hypothetical protein CWS43_10055 [Rahnella sp. AA]